MDKHTKTDPLEDFLKQCERYAQHNKTNTYNENLDNSSYKKLQESTEHNNRNHRERKDNSDDYTRPEDGRVMRKPVRLHAVTMLHAV